MQEQHKPESNSLGPQPLKVCSLTSNTATLYTSKTPILFRISGLSLSLTLSRNLSQKANKPECECAYAICLSHHHHHQQQLGFQQIQTSVSQ